VTQEKAESEQLDRAEAIRVVASSGRRLFPLISERQAREMAALVLQDLEARGIRLVREAVAAQ